MELDEETALLLEYRNPWDSIEWKLAHYLRIKEHRANSKRDRKVRPVPKIICTKCNQPILRNKLRKTEHVKCFQSQSRGVKVKMVKAFLRADLDKSKMLDPAYVNEVKTQIETQAVRMKMKVLSFKTDQDFERSGEQYLKTVYFMIAEVG